MLFFRLNVLQQGLFYGGAPSPKQVVDLCA